MNSNKVLEIAQNYANAITTHDSDWIIEHAEETAQAKATFSKSMEWYNLINLLMVAEE